MRDPNPFPPPPLLAGLTDSISSRLGLVTLPLHIHEIVGFFLLYHFICETLSPALSTWLCPRTYPRLNRRTKLNWDVHVVSFFQSVLVCALAFWVMRNDAERKRMGGGQGFDVLGSASAAVPRDAGVLDEAAEGDFRYRVWGYTGATGLVQAAATGYFTWDLWVCAVHYDVFGPGLLAHAVSALWVYGAGYRPFVNYYAPSFVLYELSSPFLNIHWFCDKLNLTGSNTQLVNGIFLILTFFTSRLIWGVWQSICVFSDIYRAVQYQSTPAGISWLAAAASSSKVVRVASSATTKPGLAKRVEEMNTLRFVGPSQRIPLWLAVLYLSANATLTGLNVFWFGKMIATIRARFEPPWGTRDVVAEEKRKLKEHETGAVDGAVDGEPLVGRGVEEDGRKTVEVSATETRATGNASAFGVPGRRRRA